VLISVSAFPFFGMTVAPEFCFVHTLRPLTTFQQEECQWTH
jgi:hypothetical protein